MGERGRATAIGLVAIGLWAGLAPSTAAAAGIPPLELLALSFAAAFAGGSLVLLVRRRSLARLRQPRSAWVAAFIAISFYHALYFFALATIPPARASLIAYLWPLLIVLFSPQTSDGDRLRPRNLVGATLGFIGVAIIFLDPRGDLDQAAGPLGYLAAFGCAAIWSGYSIINRRFADVPSDMLIGVCGAVALAGMAAHLALEDSVVPSLGQGAAILFIGLGPTGLAFLAWDHATKHGDVPLLGALSYLAPLVSTLLLVVTGQAPASLLLGASALLIVGGAVLAGRGRRSAAGAEPPTGPSTRS